MADKYFDETHDLLRETARRFVEAEIKPHIDEWEDAELFPRELYKKVADAGLYGFGFGEEFGGSEADIFHSFVVSEEFVRSGSIGVTAGLFSLGIGLPPIRNFGTQEQKEKFIPPVLAGEKISALAITEPNAGSDVANIQTRAVRDGDHYVLNGAKTFITSGCRADYITTAVRTGGEGFGGISLIVVETDTPGFRVANKIRKMGWACSDTAELAFEDCRVPATNLLGAENSGFAIIMSNFQYERLGMANQAVAAAQLAYEEAVKYAQSRNAFKRPLTGFQVTRHKLVDMATQISVAREYVYRIAALVQAGEYPVAEISMAKNIACDAMDFVVNEAVQIHGGYGYAREYLVERLYRDARIMSLGGGTTEIMKEIIAKRLDF